jgi:hypothetical protein
MRFEVQFKNSQGAWEHFSFCKSRKAAREEANTMRAAGNTMKVHDTGRPAPCKTEPGVASHTEERAEYANS